MPSEPLINLQNIYAERDGNVILRDVSWQVHSGESWVIFGPNGAGKTSLLNILQGYLWPTRGRVQVFGGTLGDGVDVRAMREDIPVVSESVRRLINDQLTGLEVIITGQRGHLNIFDPISPEEIRDATEMAVRTRVTELLEKSFNVMSTGERQRILITRALMARPRILVLDEPCSGLDLAGREWVLQLMQAISHLPDKPSLLLTTHHVEEISDVFTHALLIKEGEIYDAGPLEKVFSSENLSGLFDLPLEIGRAGNRWTAQAVR